ncbi:MAG TPA: hypothetical protein VJH87_03280 [Vicinamibacteria bacterium]|nr:hypothetical protein [Vicinamibacteria bacterium]
MSRHVLSLGTMAVLTTVLLATGGVASGARVNRYCTETAQLLYNACGNEVQDDHWVASAVCTNVSDKTERAECYAEARVARRESRQLCREQLKWRRQACKSLGEQRYDPDFDPASFETDFTNLQHPNAYFPLAIGNFWEYRGGNEVNTVEVLNETKLIDGVTCIVVNDLVFQDGDLVEDTDDWFAQATDENVWYCGEEVKDFESFDGDNPRKPELVSIDGSFKAGRDGDKPGIIFRASPVEGEAYLEEFSLGNAEDVTEIMSTAYSFGSDPELDAFVPQGLAELLCSGDCVVTKNFSLLEPGIVALKYYAAGIGFFLEVNPDDGEILQLVNCNFDAVCPTLPAP